MTDHQDTTTGRPGLTAERFERIKLALSDYGGLTREEGMFLVRELAQLERERDEARMAASAEADHADELQARNADLRKERDEARAEAQKAYQEGYEDGMDYAIAG